MPFGLKLAGYAAALARSRERLRRLRKEALVLQFGGAAGTLAALGEHGLEVAERLAALLDLPLPEAPWHSHRDRLAEVASRARDPAGTCGKIARDVVAADADRGRPRPSSRRRRPRRLVDHAAQAQSDRRGGRARRGDHGAATLPPPSSPARCRSTSARSAAGRREWPTFPALLLVTSGALAAIADIAQGLEVDAERMRANLDLTQRPDHGRSGVDRARRQDRQAARRTSSSRKRASKAVAREAPSAATC